MENSLLLGMGIALGIYLLYKMFFGNKKINNEFEKGYDKILNSDEYKVKGQYDKWLVLIVEEIEFVNEFSELYEED